MDAENTEVGGEGLTRCSRQRSVFTLRSSAFICGSNIRQRGFTLIDLLLAVCVLVIVLSLAVSLSRYVRARSAKLLTTEVLSRLDRLATQYAARHGGVYPVVPAMPGDKGGEAEEGVLDDRRARVVAAVSIREFLRALGRDPLSRDWAEQFEGLPVSVYQPGGGGGRRVGGGGGDGRDGVGVEGGVWGEERGPVVRDSWGTPIAFIARQNPAYGMSPKDEPFFVSAGPDGKFSTRGDNVYSYEVVGR